jgi:hypothetical protein
MPESERISVEEHGTSAATSKNVVDMMSTPSPMNISRLYKLGDRDGPRKKRKVSARAAAAAPEIQKQGP